MISFVCLLVHAAVLRTKVTNQALSDFRFHTSNNVRTAKVHVVFDKAFLSLVKKDGLFVTNAAFESAKYFKRMQEYVNHIFSVQLGIVLSFTWTEIQDTTCTRYPFLCDMPKVDLGLCEEDAFESKEEISVMISTRMAKFKKWVDENRSSLPNAGTYYLFTGCSYRMEEPETEIAGFKISAGFAKKYLGATVGWTGVAGVATGGTWCSQRASVGVVTKNMNEGAKMMFTQAMVLAHELGHTFGMRHYGEDFGHDTSLPCAGIMDYCGHKVGKLRRFVQENWEHDAKSVLDNQGSNDTQCFVGSTTLPFGCTIGNNVCEKSCNQLGLHHDGGDCDGSQDKTLCAPGCYSHFIGDGICDPDCMVASCWDIAFNGKREKDDCKCQNQDAVVKCQEDTVENIENCLRQCGRTMWSNLNYVWIGLLVILLCVVALLARRCCVSKRHSE